ncbi:helix-turn-helix domain-containing protein [Streptomyces sp. NBC_01565]|uniref:helix-turn-helix domain-containing protein n=1 Tax=Streptomyces sp. NBC_01565 TaxID=2975881 RepID=UPI002256850E|nr:helix-turn-helix domain-containing protein [Streptomyces sp. NBC_01565]MCX4540487.1 helix-turn-helix domain-containing protein [Streptomyces sp. NBC_01565]
MPRKGAQPVTDETRADVRRLHAEGLGRNEIARRLNRSPRTVSVICEEAGLTFDRTATAVATAAAAVDARARRLALIERYHQQIERILDRLDRQSHEVREVSFGKVVSYTVDELPAQDIRNLMTAVVTANTQAAKLEALDSDNGVNDAKSMLGQLAAGLTAAYNAMNEGDGDAP